MNEEERNIFYILSHIVLQMAKFCYRPGLELKISRYIFLICVETLIE